MRLQLLTQAEASPFSHTGDMQNVCHTIGANLRMLCFIFLAHFSHPQQIRRGAAYLEPGKERECNLQDSIYVLQKGKNA